MTESKIVFDYRQFSFKESPASVMTVWDLCAHIAGDIEGTKEYSDFLTSLNKNLEHRQLKYLASERDSIQLCFESSKDNSEMDLIFEGFVHIAMGTLDFNHVTKINISYGYSASIFYSKKYNKVLFGTMFWDIHDNVMPKCTIVAEKLVIKTKKINRY